MIIVLIAAILGTRAGLYSRDWLSLIPTYESVATYKTRLR
jgi:hypothetical protein